MKEKITLKNGMTVTLKPFIDRKTMREYRSVIMKGARNENVLDENGKVIFENGLPKTKVSLDPAQMDAGNDIIVRGIVLSIVDKDGVVYDTAKTLDEIDSLAFDEILGEGLKHLQKKEEEKKS